ncbi:hypothetical protein EIN_083650 [Entamoeba invadens IP1]|uniref:hypothetical protein n=1 Tax=Entamoeba invadens IP1 TaxID=370355 RepID=UPI0002C3F112|nr:hypothetical protein EIN_083650 [Entamoeba invadens IP1]ELP85223.1 hypothetical protein EIN_083650 [Entamoeba invadens IP1]|eukprot:XP_004184569.1 hypothetical protein EIN_083650 [Entamoeba invadens IP1]
MSDKRKTKKHEKPEKAEKAVPEKKVVDNSKDSFDFKHEFKNSEFDFGSSDSDTESKDKNDHPDDKSEEQDKPKRKFNVVLTDTPTLKKTASIQKPKFNLPPSRLKSNAPPLEQFQAGIQFLETGDFTKASAAFGLVAEKTENKNEAQLALAYHLCSDIFQKINGSPATMEVFLISLLLGLPLLAPHRKIVIDLATNFLPKQKIQIPDYVAQEVGIDKSVNENNQVLHGKCWSCGKEISLLALKCVCGAERYIDCSTLAPVAKAPVKCEKCGAVYEDGKEMCTICKGNCSKF